MRRELRMQHTATRHCNKRDKAHCNTKESGLIHPERCQKMKLAATRRNEREGSHRDGAGVKIRAHDKKLQRVSEREVVSQRWSERKY